MWTILAISLFMCFRARPFVPHLWSLWPMRQSCHRMRAQRDKVSDGGLRAGPASCGLLVRSTLLLLLDVNLASILISEWPPGIPLFVAFSYACLLFQCSLFSGSIGSYDFVQQLIIADRQCRLVSISSTMSLVCYRTTPLVPSRSSSD
jgi:hypothetical protein